MKSFVIVFTLLLKFALYSQNNVDYVKFSETPTKRISYTNISEHNYFVEYKSHKKGSIFFELIKDEIVVARSKTTVKSKDLAIAKLNLKAKSNKRLNPGSGYMLRLSLYASDTKSKKKLVSEVIVDDVSLTRLLYSKL